MNKYLKKTKIIATLGPASSSKEVMLGLMKAGVDVFRINFSHADYDLVRTNIQAIRDLNKEYGYSVGILADLQGPKLRVGVVKEGSYLNPGDILTFTNEKNRRRFYESLYDLSAVSSRCKCRGKNFD